MEKVNIRFHENYTVTYQHKKILQFVPELSTDKNLKVITPNIPLLVSLNAQSIQRSMIFLLNFDQLQNPVPQTLSTQSNSLGSFLGNGVNVALSMTKLFSGERFQPFISVTVNELLFGYEDTLVSMANKFYPRNIRPDMSKMGLLLGVSE